MTEQASPAKLGLFVIAATAVLVAALVALGSGTLFRDTFPAETAIEESTQGLEVGAPVKHRGVRIGSVTRVAFAGTEYPEAEADPRVAGMVVVEMKLDRDRLPGSRPVGLDRLVAVGLRARLASSGLVTPPYLELAFVDSQAVATAVPWRPRRLFIPSTRSVGGSLPGQTEKALTDASGLLSDARRAIEGVEIARVQEETLALVRELRAAVAKLDGTIGDASSVAANARKVAEDEKTARTLDDVARAGQALPPVVADLRRLVRRLDALVAAHEADLEATLASLRQLADNARAVSEDAARNPSHVLLGEPPPRVDPGKLGP